MKRLISALLLLALSLSLVSCGKDREYDQHYYNHPSETDPSDTPAPSPSAEPEPLPVPGVDENPYAEALEAEFPSCRIECSYEELLEMKHLASVFSNAPEEFVSPDQLSDSCKFFTAVSYLGDQFEMLEDGFTMGLPITAVTDAVSEVFGRGVELSPNWFSSDYSPFMLDTENGMVLTYGIGMPNTFLYTWAALVKEDGTYELWMLNLVDPLFSADEENTLLVEAGNGDAVPIDLVENIARQMQTNVYTFSKGENGLCLTGFRYENYKGVSNFLTFDTNPF